MIYHLKKIYHYLKDYLKIKFYAIKNKETNSAHLNHLKSINHRELGKAFIESVKYKFE